MATDLKEKGWEKVQIKAFTAWLNGYLAKRNLEVTDIQKQLDDGVRLINFLELLSERRVTQKWVQKPPSRIQKIENLHIALTFLEKEIGVKSTGASAEDFADCNLKMILGFFWGLFKRYKIQTIREGGKSSEAGLLAWCQKTTEGYRDVHIESFAHSFRTGMAFLALNDKYVQDKEILDYEKYQKENSVDNLNTAFEIAEKHLGIPKLLDAKEVSEGNVDERSLVLYISLYFHAFVAKEQQRIIKEEKERIEQSMKGLQGSLEDRAKLAATLQEENTKLQETLTQLRERLQREEDDNNGLKEELSQLREQHAKEKADAEALKLQLEQQIAGLTSQVSELTTKLQEEQEARKKEQEEHQSRNKTSLNGLGVLKKNLEQHVEDLRRWQKYLDFDLEAEIDFSGEIRPQILTEIKNEEFDSQLDYLAKKLDKENSDLENLLKSKEAEKKAKKDNEKKKKHRSQVKKFLE